MVSVWKEEKIKALKFWSNDNKTFEYYICIESPKTENKKNIKALKSWSNLYS